MTIAYALRPITQPADRSYKCTGAPIVKIEKRHYQWYTHLDRRSDHIPTPAPYHNVHNIDTPLTTQSSEPGPRGISNPFDLPLTVSRPEGHLHALVLVRYACLCLVLTREHNLYIMPSRRERGRQVVSMRLAAAHALGEKPACNERNPHATPQAPSRSCQGVAWRASTVVYMSGAAPPFPPFRLR